MPQDITTDQAVIAQSPRRRPRKQSRVFSRTTMRRAIIEAMIIFCVGRLLSMVPVAFWPAPVYPLVLVARLTLAFSPPVWAAMRVVSTKREKMSRRFWLLGPRLALVCAIADAIIALAVGDFYLFGGPANGPDILRFGKGLSPFGFLATEVGAFALLLVYYTIAVVCTRLANGGFLRFTMPAGNGRVTL